MKYLSYLFVLTSISLLSGCGLNNSVRTHGGNISRDNITKAIVAATGGTLTTGSATLTIPANAISADGNVFLEYNPPTLPTIGSVPSLISGVRITLAPGLTFVTGAKITLSIPSTRLNAFPVYAFRLTTTRAFDVDATVAADGKTATIPIAQNGYYAMYNLKGSSGLPKYPDAKVMKIEKLDYSQLYGNCRIRIKNLLSNQLQVSVMFGTIAASNVRIAYIDQEIPTTASATDGGAIDVDIPPNLARGTFNINVSLSGNRVPPFPITVTNNNPYSIFKLAKGGIFVAELRRDKAPKTVDNFTGLATGTKQWFDPLTGLAGSGPFYDGTKFHRVITAFVRQGGDILSKLLPEGDPRIGTGTPGYTIDFETTGLLHNDGALAMARGNAKNSAGSQFYVADGPQHSLDGQYVVFGQVVDGLDKAKAIIANDVLTSVSITSKIDGP